MPRRWRFLALGLLLVASLAEPVAETLTTDRAHYVEGALDTPRPVVEATAALSNASIPIVAMGVLFLVLLWSRVNGAALLVVVLPTLTLVAIEFVSGRAVSPSLLLPAIAGVLLVALRVKSEDLVLLGYAGAAVATASLVGFVVAPSMVLMSAGLAHADKSLTGAPLLAGIFSHSNSLGLFLAAAAPFVFLERRFVLRWAMVAAIATALVLSSSRTALFGAGAVIVAILLGWILPRVAFRLVAAVAAVAVAVLLVLVPFSERDPSAYTYRGEIWMYNIERLEGHLPFGLGAWWYSDHYGELKAALSAAASHAHNSLLTALVMGGVALAAAAAVLVMVAWRGATRSAERREVVVGVAFLLGLLASSVAETAVRFSGWGPLAATSLVPLFVYAIVATTPRTPVESVADGTVTPSGRMPIAPSPLLEPAQHPRASVPDRLEVPRGPGPQASDAPAVPVAPLTRRAARAALAARAAPGGAEPRAQSAP